MPRPPIYLRKSRRSQGSRRSSSTTSLSFLCGLVLTTTNTRPGTSPAGPIRAIRILVVARTLPLITSKSSCTWCPFLINEELIHRRWLRHACPQTGLLGPYGCDQVVHLWG